MICYRISKYNPIQRDSFGLYLHDTWTSISDIGRQYGTVALEYDHYWRIESAYVYVISCLWKMAGQPDLSVLGLEIYADPPESQFEYPSVIQNQDALENIVRESLRQKIWCRLEADDGFFVHFGNEMYVYLGHRNLSELAIDRCSNTDIYVEPFVSPYLIQL